MAKSKKNVDDFQKAMLANTKNIKEDPPSEERETNELKNALTISAETQKRIKLFAEKYNLEPDDVAELALQHFLDMEGYWFKK
ncbi:MAG: hypothetical protein ACOC2E_05910 [Bacteroidota bacterium]